MHPAAGSAAHKAGSVIHWSNPHKYIEDQLAAMPEALRVIGLESDDVAPTECLKWLRVLSRTGGHDTGPAGLDILGV